MLVWRFVRLVIYISVSQIQFGRESVLEHFVNKVQCRGMFSTHYHRLAVDYEGDPKVCLCIVDITFHKLNFLD